MGNQGRAALFVQARPTQSGQRNHLKMMLLAIQNTLLDGKNNYLCSEGALMREAKVNREAATYDGDE